MRIVNVLSSGHHSVGVGSGFYVNKNWSASTFSSSRSDIVINAKSVTGWRKPSAYSCSVEQHDIGAISYSATRLPDRYNPTRPPQPGWFHASCGALYTQPGRAAPNNRVDTVMLNAALPSVAFAQQAVIKARNNVADRKASFATSFVEMRSSVAGLARNASSINAFLIAASRRDWFNAAKALGLGPKSRRARRARDRTIAAGQGISSAWLNYWFGLSPIVSDMVAIAAFMSNDESVNRLRIKGSAVVPYLKRETIETLGPTSAWSGPYFTSSSSVLTESFAACSLWYKIPDAEFRRLVTFGAVDIPATLWAVVPWSFVVDWVLPVSEILKSMTATVGLTFIGGSLTRVTKISKSPLSYSFSPYNASMVMETSSFHVNTVRGMKMIRSIYTSDPLPVGMWVKDPFDVWKGITSLALLSNLLRKP